MRLHGPLWKTQKRNSPIIVIEDTPRTSELKKSENESIPSKTESL